MKTSFFLSCLVLLASPASFAEPFIDYSLPGTKVRFTQVVVGGQTVTQAEAIVTSTNSAGVITVKRQTQVIVPDGQGGYDQIVTSEQTVATPTGTAGVYDVTVDTEKVTTELDEDQKPTGAPPTTTDNEVTTKDVLNPDLPEATTYTPIDPDLDEPVVISAP